MRTVEVDSFAAWRDKARALLRAGEPPNDLFWTAPNDGSLFAEDLPSPRPDIPPPRVPKEFMSLAEEAACFRDPERWALLYRLLWRINTEERHLLEIASDNDVTQLRKMVQEVRRDIHKMHAFVRFRKLVDPDGAESYVAWHEPTHLVVERGTPFFARRFDSMTWAILTPDRCAYWDKETLRFGPGLTREHAPTGDDMENLWKTYYRNIFNPSRVKISAMVAEMPKKYWRTMPETALIPEMLAEAEARVETMLEHAQSRREGALPDDAAQEIVASHGTVADLRALASGCQACELYKNATQTVFSEGPINARIVLVGEQPGDQEDLQGRPFVGPAGTLLRQTLERAGLTPDEVYFTNTVKHFRWEPSPYNAKKRIHQRATVRQIDTCKGWVKGEIAIMQPEVVVLLGATAGQALVGPSFRIGRDRSRWLDSSLAPKVMATVHPSFLLRITDPAEKERQKEMFLQDLRMAASAISAAG